ncbi:MAG: FAD-dependent oxidoreductase [Acidobacteria bacterium]|nr:FAD-dependent oxidoreductase [Acidobacteriota bacterium]
MLRERTPIVVLGAGPAGLATALRLARRGAFEVTVIERQGVVGGNAGSFELEGLRVDYGSHRLHASCRPEILADIRAMLGAALLSRPRNGRIRLRGRWVRFPLHPLNLALHLPPAFFLGVLRDAVTKSRQGSARETFGGVLERGLGKTICRDFYFPYAEKIWGLPPSELDAEQARRRVSAGSLSKVLRKVAATVPGLRASNSACFFYPRNGYGQISEAYYRAATEAGVAVRFRETLTGVELADGRVVAVRTCGEDGVSCLPARQVISTIPLPSLVRSVTPPAPPEVLASTEALRYRAMILIYLVMATTRFTEYDAHYFPERDVAITRLSEPKNYGLAEVDGTTVLCAELPCSPQEPVWKASDQELGALVEEALARADLPLHVPLRRVVTRRLEQAYPIYTLDYREHFDRLDDWVKNQEGLLSIGRQGLFAHDNTHHTLAMAYGASDCLDPAGKLDRERWAVYRRDFEEFVVED